MYLVQIVQYSLTSTLQLYTKNVFTNCSKNTNWFLNNGIWKVKKNLCMISLSINRSFQLIHWKQQLLFSSRLGQKQAVNSLSRTCSEDELETLIGEEIENLPKTTNLPGYRCYNKVRTHHMFSRILKLRINEKKSRNCRVFCLF